MAFSAGIDTVAPPTLAKVMGASPLPCFPSLARTPTGTQVHSVLHRLCQAAFYDCNLHPRQSDLTREEDGPGSVLVHDRLSCCFGLVVVERDKNAWPLSTPCSGHGEEYEDTETHNFLQEDISND